MARLSFRDFRFEQIGEGVKVHFLKLYTFMLDQRDLHKIGKYSVEGDAIVFPSLSEDKARKGFMRLLGKSMTHLTNKISGNPTLYIHQNSGIPLIGSMSFGIVDKGSDLLEIKPLTSCNADCIFCSVDEGPSSKKTLDIVIEKDYLVSEIKKLLDFKGSAVHIYINPQGEPLLYAEIVDLVRDLSSLEHVKAVSIITNGMLLTQKMADSLISAGLHSFNVSFHSLDPENARKLFNIRGYNVGKVKKTLEYLKGKIRVIIAPVFMKGMNEEDISQIAQYCATHGFELGVQNFLINKRGRNPVKEIEFDDFFRFLDGIEKKYKPPMMKLGEIGKTKQLPKPFQKGDQVPARFVSVGRYPHEFLVSASDRLITVSGEPNGRTHQKVRITRSTHNIFFANTL